MNYKSIANLSDDIRLSLHKIPRDVDLVVGIPRSGMLAAYMVALNLNLKICDFEAFLSNAPLKKGMSRRSFNDELIYPSDAKHILFIDDSVSTGAAMTAYRPLALNAIQTFNPKIKTTFCAVYMESRSISFVDFYFEILSQPRVFEWNLFHREFISSCCVDIDGVLCVDPTSDENDDGEKYERFLENTKPLIIPSYPIGYLVTSRLEKYRNSTENWLKKWGIQYGKLYMLDLPSAEERRRRRCHGSYKSAIYSSIESCELFIESEPIQSVEIANKSGKEVLCFTNQQLYQPSISTQLLVEKSKPLRRRLKNLIKKRILF